MKPQRLELSEKEETLKGLLVDVAAWIDQTAPIKGEDGKAVPTVLRWTGGWVRDKLLGIASQDIDIAINNMTGSAFALKMNEYLERPGILEKYGIKTIHGLHDIKSNPEKSKHLDTVTTKLLGLDLDFVNLRKEVYDETSRIPQIEPTDDATDDALRRDATVNAMFYNLQDSKVEDLTGHGLEDLEAGIIRTPLEPVKTFRDDPLRVLRLIRFSSRYNFKITQEVKAAMMNAGIKAALQRKISRERVGVELQKMLKGPDPQMALSLIDELGLYSTVFSVPDIETSFEPETSSWRLNYTTVRQLLATAQATEHTDMKTNHDRDQARGILIGNSESEYLAWILSCFVPYNDAPEPEPTKTGKKPPPLAAVIARDGIKAPNKVSDIVAASVENAADILNVKDAFTSKRQAVGDHDPRRRDTLGKGIRRWGATWRNQALFAYLLDVDRAQLSERGETHAKSRKDGIDQKSDALKEWAAFLSHLKEQDLLEVYDLKPIIDGNALAKALNVRPGPWMKDALEVVVSWQLRNPSVETVEAAVSAVTSSPQSPLGKGLPPYQTATKGRADTEVQKPGQQQKQRRPSEKQSEPDADTGELTACLIAHFLRNNIRPLFSKTTASHRQETITATGRARAAQALPLRRHEGFEDEAITRPWKTPKEQPSLDLLRWCIDHLTPAVTEAQWPFLIPPLLALLDDTDTSFRALGARFLTSLLSSTSSTLLSRTGLAAVFQDALRPSLHALPSLTPASESATLLSTVYPALFALTSLRHANALKDEKAALATHLHDHLLPSLSHIEHPSGSGSAYPSLITILLAQTSTLVQKLGIDAVPEVPHLLPVLRGVISDNPFAVNSPEAVECTTQAVRTLTRLIAAAWMRAGVWRWDVLEILAGGWGRCVDARGAERTRQMGDVDELGGLEGELRTAVEVLVMAVEASGAERDDGDAVNGETGSVEFALELRQVVEADQRLEGLFGKYAAKQTPPNECRASAPFNIKQEGGGSRTG